MDINQISNHEKHPGKSLKQIYSGMEKLPSSLLDENVKLVISWFLPLECLQNVQVKDARIKISGLKVQDMKFINLTIRKSLNYYFSNDEEAWDCPKFDDLNCPPSYRDFLSRQGDPAHIKWLIENNPDFYIPDEELRQLEQLPVYRFSKFRITYVSDELLKYMPVMLSFSYRFPDEVKRLNQKKSLIGNLAG